MFRSRWLAIKEEILSFSIQEKLFALCCMVCGFFICADYAIVRPVSNSLFIHAYGAEYFPYAWLTMVPLNLFLVALYSRFLPSLGVQNTFFVILSAIFAMNLFCAFFIDTLPFLPFVLYVWKEIYVVLLFQQLWSQIHSSTLAGRAKYLYGILFGIGGIGGVVGSLVPGFFAIDVGSEKLLFCATPLYLILGIAFFALFKQSSAPVLQPRKNEPFFQEVTLIARSRRLFSILGLVVCMQLSATLIDYQFNTSLAEAIPEKDARTEYFGRVMAIVQCLTASMQFFGTFLLLHFLGLKRSHLLVPVLLGANALSYLVFPLFGIVTWAFISIKALDFSLFGILKEMLYLETKPEEKYRAKAFIDVFAYRSSKALASLLILGVQLVAGATILPVLTWSSMAIFALWIGVVSWCFREPIAKESLYDRT